MNNTALTTTAPADGATWTTWWDAMEAGTQAVSDRLVALAELRSGHRVLDVATGVGEPALTAARCVAPLGHVVAIDHEPTLLARARRRAATAGCRNVEFVAMDAEALALPPAHFDAVLCRWGLMFLRDLPGALHAVRAALVPGGRFAAAVWDAPANVPVLNLASTIVRREFGLRAPAPDAPSAFRLADPAALARTLRDAGFRDVRWERVEVAAEFPSPESYAEYFPDVGAESFELLSTLPADRLERLCGAITDAARAYATDGGRVRMPNSAICLVARC